MKQIRSLVYISKPLKISFKVLCPQKTTNKICKNFKVPWFTKKSLKPSRENLYLKDTEQSTKGQGPGVSDPLSVANRLVRSRRHADDEGASEGRVCDDDKRLGFNMEMGRLLIYLHPLGISQSAEIPVRPWGERELRFEQQSQRNNQLGFGGDSSDTEREYLSIESLSKGHYPFLINPIGLSTVPQEIGRKSLSK